MKHNWKDIVVSPYCSIIEVLEIIDRSSLQFTVVVNEDMKLLGTVTDGDVRRGILKGINLKDPIRLIMNTSPIVGNTKKPYRDQLPLLYPKNLKQLPIIDDTGKLVDIVFREHSFSKENLVVLMVGGLGTRLSPLTDHIPKPMLKVGEKPILETIIEGFKRYGYTNFILSVNYKKEIIQNYFQNGASLGVSIRYIEETKRMGTAGALSLLKEKPSKPFFVMNGDLLTQVNFDQLLQFHEEHHSVATMCVREFNYQIPYGVIETEGSNLTGIEEKPIHKYFVNAGIYVLDPEVLECVPEDNYYDMPTLFSDLIAMNKNPSVFPIREYWLDIGQMDDFRKANIEFEERYL